jgi:hypothetical protein
VPETDLPRVLRIGLLTRQCRFRRAGALPRRVASAVAAPPDPFGNDCKGECAGEA